MMPPKRSAAFPGHEPKCKRKMLTIKEKVELLDMLQERRSYAAVGRHYGINESTVRSIKKEEKNIRSTATVTFNKMAKRVITHRNKLIVKMESVLALWIHDCREENISLDTNTIRTKAKQLYDCMAENMENGGDDKAGPSTSTGSPTKAGKFAASKGWFHKFQKRYGLQSVFLHGKAASGINESTVRDIKTEEENIQSTATVTFNEITKRVITPHTKSIVNMESALALWIDDCCKKNISLDTNTIRTKAMQLYDCMAENMEDQEEDDDEDDEAGTSTLTGSPTESGKFAASKGWFHTFQKHYGLKSVGLYGEAASADKAAAEDYVNNTFKEILKEGGYRPEQVFNMHETGLFWKRMPSRTFLMKEEATAPGFKAQKDRATLIMCGNAAGFMIKPGLIYKAKNPRALKNKNKNVLPVHWMHHPKACITKILMRDWFHQCFIPEVKVYLAEKGIDFNVLLLMDNAGGHAVDITHDGVQVEFLPPSTASLIQPMDQGIIRAFKALYTRNSLQSLVEAMDMDEDFSLKESWHDYTIASCLKNIQKAITEMKTETLNACWEKLWPEVVHDYKGFSPDEIHHSAVDNAVRLAKILGGEGFSDMTAEDVNDLLDMHSLPLMDEDLEEEEQQRDEEEEVVGLTLERLATLQEKAQELQQLAEDWDTNTARSLQFRNSIDSCMSVYKTMLTQAKKQRQQLPYVHNLHEASVMSMPLAEVLGRDYKDLK
ncbi:tigger transposable element-derived protein 1-like [Anolis carolinensis]|uniref:tigger transposable element-derived protein 1-like n=1 Tax=Anolis carolinensis TaxID=28377 RepID=UPI002F2B4B2F